MTDNQAARLEAIAHEHEALFVLGVIRIVDQAAALIQKGSLRLLKGDSMLRQVGTSLAAVPGEFDIAHSIILAIPPLRRYTYHFTDTIRI